MRSLWSNVLGNSLSRRAKRKQTNTRLAVETLEDRVVPTLNWSSGIALPYAQTDNVAVQESDHSLVVLGGTTSVYQLSLGATAWTTAASLPSTLISPGVSLESSGNLLVYGGSGLNTAMIYNPTTGVSSQTVASMSAVHSLMAFATDGSDRAYAIGGLDSNGTPSTTVERYDPSTGAWSTVASLPTALSGAVAVYDGAGDIYVFGGATSTALNSSTALKYNVASNTWSTVASMSSATTEAAAVMGPDGLIYVMGGKNSDGSQRSAVKAYNPATNTWSSATSLSVPVSNEAAVVDAQNSIEVIGGTALGDDPYTSSAVYVTQTLANYAPIITATSLPSATEGTTYTATIAAVGLPAPTFSVLSGTATGLTIDSTTGVITWAPTSAQLGSHTVTVQATNSVGITTQTYTLTVTTDITPPTAPVLTMAAITTTNSITLNWAASTDNVGVAGYRLYSYTPAYVTGHSGKGGGGTYHPAVYTLIVNNISPSTLSYTVTGLNPDTLYYYALAAFDAAGNQSAYSDVVSGTTWQLPAMEWYFNSYYNTPISIVANHPLSFSMYVSAGNPTPTMSLTSEPTGASYSLNTVTWTPTESQVGVNDFIFQATNSAGTTTLDVPVTVTADVAVPSLVVNGGYAYGTGNMTAVTGTPNDYQLALYQPTFGTTAAAVQYAMVGTPFAFQFTGTANTNPITYALVSGPSSMTINSSTGVGAWTPTASDASAATSVTVSATNSAGTTLLTFTFPTYFTTAPTNVVVGFQTNTSGAAPTTYSPVVTWTAPTDASAIADYQIAVTSATTNVTTLYDTQSTATSFTLPAGITGQNWVNVIAYDANGNPSQSSTTNAPLYSAALTSLGWTLSSPTAVVGQAWSAQFSALYSTYAILSGPTGATINSTTGVVSWTPTLADVGTADITAAAVEGWGDVFTTLSIPVITPVAPTTTTLTGNGPSPSTFGQSVSFTATVSGGSAINGETVTIEDASNGDAVVATPTLSGGAVTFSIANLSVGTHELFAVYSGDAIHAGSDSSETPVTINPALSISTPILPNWTVNQPGYSQTIAVTGGTGGDTFAVTGGALATGLSLSGSAALTGTPTAAGYYTFTVTATDSVGATATHTYSIAVNPPITLSPATLPAATVNVPYNQTISADGTESTFYADQVVSYASGSIPDASYSNPAAALGGLNPVVGNFGGSNSYLTPFNPAYSASDLVEIGAGGSLVLRLAQTASTDGYTIGVHTGFGLTDANYPDGINTNPAGYLNSWLRQADVRVSADGLDWGDLGTVTFENPSNIDTGAATDPEGASPGVGPTADPGRPFLGTLGSFNGLNWQNTLTALNGSAGGTWLNLSGVTDANGNPITGVNYIAFSVPTNPPLDPNTSNPELMMVDAVVGISGAANGGTGTISFAVSAGSLPSGLTLNSATGAITGTPTTNTGSVSNFTVTATDSDGATASQTYSIAINTAPIAVTSATVNGDLLNTASTITAADETGNSVQITTAAAHGLYVGELVAINGVGTAGFNGTYSVTAVLDSTDFTYTDPTANLGNSNGGTAVNALAGSQRSMVDSITYQFNQAVTLSAGAISMDVNSGYTGTAGALPGDISYATIDDGHTWLVTFSGANVTGNSIADGVYDITLNAADVTSNSGGGNLASSRTDTFFRLFGDSNGDAAVNARPDTQAFAFSFGMAANSSAYLAYFDYDAAGSISSRPDVQNFAARFGTSLSGFTATI